MGRQVGVEVEGQVEQWWYGGMVWEGKKDTGWFCLWGVDRGLTKGVGCCYFWAKRNGCGLGNGLG